MQIKVNGETVTAWFHIETTLEDGTVWKSTSAIPTFEDALEWISTAQTAYGQPAIQIKITRHRDMTLAEAEGN